MAKAVIPSLGTTPISPDDLTTGPCSAWITADDVERLTGCTEVAEDDPMLRVASDVLYELSGQRFPGNCAVTVNPGIYCACDTVWHMGGVCCDGTRYLKLGTDSVRTVEAVRLDGETLDPSEYRVHGGRLYRLPDGSGARRTWPCCRQPDRVPDERIEVDFTYGDAVPSAGVLAAATLACELVRANGGDDGAECRLPKRVQTITRQGVTMALLDPMSFLENGRTGIYEVDLFLSAYVSSGGARESGITNPDMPRARRAQG